MLEFIEKKFNDKYIFLSVFLLINYPIFYYIFEQLFNGLIPTFIINFIIKLLIYSFALFCFFCVTSKKRKNILKFSSIFIILICLTFLIDNSFFVLRFKIIIKFILNCVLLFYILYSIGDVEKILKNFYKMSYFNLFLCILYYLQMLNNKTVLLSQGQTLSYILSFYSLILIYYITSKFNGLDFFCLILDLFLLLQFGSRTILLVVLLYLFYRMFFLIWKKYLTLNLKKKKLLILFLVLLLGIGLLVLFNLKEISLFLYDFLMSKGIYNRFLRLLSEGTFLSSTSGRFDSFYTIIFDGILSNPLGKGLAYDRVLIYQNYMLLNSTPVSFEGCYSHNFFLEYFITFGIPLGIFILYRVLRNIIKIFKKYNYKDIIILFFFIGFVPLLLTSSFLVYKNFWIFISVILIIMKKEDKISEKN